MKTAKDKSIIGRKIKIDFPELKLSNVVAKIDTGSYRGTLHCTDIKVVEKEGKKYLSLVPLDLKHPDFTHEPVLTDKYHRSWIKTSTGQVQYRYFIKTKVAYNDHTYPLEISLSDRTDMRVPVLLGRKFLRGRFMVDVDHEEHKMHLEKG